MSRRRQDPDEGKDLPIPYRRLAELARPERRLIGWGTLALLIGGGAGLVYPKAFGWIVDDASKGDATVIQRDVLVMLGVIAVQSLGIGLRMHLFTIAGERIVARLRRRLYAHVLSQEIAFFDGRRTGELMSRLASDTTVMQTTVTINASMALRNIVLLTGSVIMMFLISVKLAGLMIGVVPLIAISAIFIAKRLQKLSRASQDALADSGALAEESLSSMRTVRAFGRERSEAGRYGEAVDRSFTLARRRSARLSTFVAVSYFASFAVVAVGLWLGFRLKEAGEISGGDLLSFVLYGATAGFGISGLGEIWGELMKVRGAGQRVFELLDRSPAMPLGTAAPEGSAAPAGVQPLDVRGGVELRDVTFRYPSRPDVAALEDVSLVIRPGEIVALVGPSGAGKSTIAALLPRFYDPDVGAVLLDGMDLRRLDPGWLRGRLGMVAQEPVLFGTSIAENIRYGRTDATDAQVEAAARAAHAHEFVERLPERYATLVGERGVQLSGGQKQRVAIARAILKDPAVLILDEATSALDAESEALVREALAVLQRGRTCLVIAHRLSTVRDADRVVVLDRGRIVQQGRHAELVADESGLYAQLVQRQLAAV
ncbi:MAG TPA: ABC transporter transmembrane domain-containing protein [Planctomycetota bacterium]|nr:ABC transporter transmembrane domain-containing protein [Planctomycetota bacterium]